MNKEGIGKYIKKSVIGLIIPTLVMTSIPIDYFMREGSRNVYASEDITQSSEYTYNIMYNNDGSAFAIVTSYVGSDEVINVPETLDGYIVEEIGVNAFADNKNIVEVILPATVRYIDRYAFKGCSSLEKISIPENVTYIGGYCFLECTSLENIVLPKSISSVEDYLFYKCNNLKQIVIPDSVTMVKACAFQHCTALNDIKLSNNIETICEDAFWGCSSLKNLEIPNSLVRMETMALYNTGIKKLKIPNAKADISVCLFDYKLDKSNDYRIIGTKGSSVEKFAKDNFMLFESLDGTYKCDYREVSDCYNNSYINYKATIEHLNEYYLEKYPDMALGLTYSTESEREFFKEIAQTTVDRNQEVAPAEALYNWMNKNISVGEVQYGYPMDVYNFRSADCLGNALLLCELLRSVGIPAVTTYGYACDTKNVDETVLIDSVGHAWVLAYYNNKWNLLDSGMDRILTDEEEISRWYYTMAINNYYQVFNEKYNSKLSSCLVYFKDGKYVIYRDRGIISQNMGSWSLLSMGENVNYLWNNFNGNYAGETFIKDGSVVEAVPGKEGLIADNTYIYYMNIDTSISCNMFVEDGDELYYANQNGVLFDFSELKGNCRIKRGIPVVNKGTIFNIQPLCVEGIDANDIKWTSNNKQVAIVEEDGSIKTLQTGYVTLDGVLDGNIYFIELFVDDFVTEISMETNLELKVGDKVTLNPEVNCESTVFGNYNWESSDESIVTVDDMGNVTAVKEGVADIIVLYGDGSGLSSSCKVVVTSEDVKIKETIGNEGIYIEYEKDVVEEDTNLVSEKIDKDDKVYEEIGVKDDVQYEAFDITLVDKQDNVVQPNGKLRVRIPCPKEFKGHKCSVYHVLENGKFVDMYAVRQGDYLVFDTNHFSVYIVTEDKLITGVESESGDINKDGEINSTDAVLMQKYLAGYEDIDISVVGGDLNGDGEITTVDAVMLLKYLAGYDGIIEEEK